MVILLGLAAAVLYGSGDFLGGIATRRARADGAHAGRNGRGDRRARRRGSLARSGQPGRTGLGASAAWSAGSA